MIGQITEQLSPLAVKTKEDHMLYLRHHMPYILVALLFGSKSKTCADIGSGKGYGCFTLGRKFKSVIGIDTDKKSVEESIATYSPHNLHVHFKMSKDENFGLPERSVDMITSFQVIEHIKNADAFVSSIHKVLKPNGCALLTTPNRELRLENHEKPWNRFHVTEYKKDALKILLQKKYEDKNVIEHKFRYVDVLGVTGIEEVLEVELARLKKVRELVKKDKLKLHRRMPLFLYYPLVGALVKTLPKKEEGSYGFKFEENVYFLTDDISKSIDILAFCTDNKKKFSEWARIKKRFMKPYWKITF